MAAKRLSWNGQQWLTLSGFGIVDETNDLTRDGTVYWTGDPFNWSVYSIDGGPDLFYVRAYLASGSYTTTPVEGIVKTDILLFQYCRTSPPTVRRSSSPSPARPLWNWWVSRPEGGMAGRAALGNGVGARESRLPPLSGDLAGRTVPADYLDADTWSR